LNTHEIFANNYIDQNLQINVHLTNKFALCFQPILAGLVSLAASIAIVFQLNDACESVGDGS
jgi:hypothetical protein